MMEWMGHYIKGTGNPNVEGIKEWTPGDELERNKGMAKGQ